MGTARSVRTTHAAAPNVLATAARNAQRAVVGMRGVNVRAFTTCSTTQTCSANTVRLLCSVDGRLHVFGECTELGRTRPSGPPAQIGGP
jgi:hypothetical protein